MPTPRMLPALLRLHVVLLLCGALAAAESDVLESDLWFVGKLNGQPAMTIHAAVTKHADGTRSDTSEMVFLISRTLGATAMRFETREAQAYVDGADGRIAAFRFDHVEGGETTSAVGKVVGDEVVATVHHLDRTTEQRLPIPPGTRLLGQQAGQELLVAHPWKAGQQERFSGLNLLGNQVQIVDVTATFVRTTPTGNLVFTMLMDQVAVPMTTTVTPTGQLAGMGLSVGPLVLELLPSPGPVPLAGAELSPTGLVTATGPAPAAGPRNRYRMPPGGSVAEDEFQHLADGVVTVTASAPPAPLPDPAPLLRATPQLETDDPALRAWVQDVAKGHEADLADLAEQLRLAVRGHITTKDLSKGDASALEAFRTRTGDCTEHANLLCAALRIAGIPARVEDGLVFAADFGGWVGHAWNSAYIGGRWVHLDSAYPGIPRSCYLKLATNSGGAWKSTGALMVANLVALAGKEIETLKP